MKIRSAFHGRSYSLSVPPSRFELGTPASYFGEGEGGFPIDHATVRMRRFYYKIRGRNLLLCWVNSYYLALSDRAEDWLEEIFIPV